MNVPIGMLLFSLFMSQNQNAQSKIESKIDVRLLRKVSTFGPSKLSAIIFSHEKELHHCKGSLEKMGANVIYDLPIINAYAVEFQSSKLNEMAKHDSVKYIHDDVKISSFLDIATQVVGSRIANDTGYTGKGVGIAVLDTGIYPHPDLTRSDNRIIVFKDFVNKKDSPYDDNGHGTFVAGVAAGNGYSSNGKYAGVAPEANLIGVKVMNENGEGKSSDILAGMQWVVDNREKYNIKVMSLSLGSKPSGFFGTDPLVAAVNEVWKKGIFVVAAAGNSGPKRSTIATPGISPNIITVGAVDDKRTVDIKDDVVADFSSRGPVNGRVKKPDVVAPGVGMVSLNTDAAFVPGSRYSTLKEHYKTMSGTSVSTPLVSGVGALIIGQNPKYTPDQVKELIMKNARDIKSSVSAQGKGIIDVKTVLGIK